jgi:hypothetical protein
MKIKAYLSVIFVIATQSFCISQTLFKPGKYKCENVDITFIFYPDSTFGFDSYGEDIRQYHSTGEWKIENGQIIINSKIQSKLQPITISYSNMKEDKKDIGIELRITVNDSTRFTAGQGSYYTAENYFSEPYTNDSILILEPMVDIYELKPSEIIWSNCFRHGSYSFHVDTLFSNICFNITRHSPEDLFDYYRQGLSVKTETKELNCALSDSITIDININDELFGYRVFTNEILPVENNQLIFRDVLEFYVKGRKEYYEIMRKLFWKEEVL